MNENPDDMILYYTKTEGGYWHKAKCVVFSYKETISILTKVWIDQLKNPPEFHSIMFPNGLIWDTTLHAFDTYRKRKLPKSFPFGTYVKRKYERQTTA